MQVGIPACTPASSHAVKRASIHKGQQVLSQPSSALKKIFFQKKTEKREKEKESNLKGRDADRPKGIGISPEGCLGRNEQGIMPKSFARLFSPSYLRFLFIISLDKI